MATSSLVFAAAALRGTSAAANSAGTVGFIGEVSLGILDPTAAFRPGVLALG